MFKYKNKLMFKTVITVLLLLNWQEAALFYSCWVVLFFAGVLKYCRFGEVIWTDEEHGYGTSSVCCLYPKMKYDSYVFKNDNVSW